MYSRSGANTEPLSNARVFGRTAASPPAPSLITGPLVLGGSGTRPSLMAGIPRSDSTALVALGVPSISGAAPAITIKLMMQKKECGSIIGKGGDYIKYIRETSGAKIHITESTAPERVVTMSGTLEQAYWACDMICKKLAEDKRLQASASSADTTISMRVLIPLSQCAMMMGRMNDIKELTGAWLNMGEGLPGTTDRSINVFGTPEVVVHGIQQISQIICDAPELSLPPMPLPGMGGGYSAVKKETIVAPPKESGISVKIIMQKREVGSIIGRGGDHIRAVRETSNCNVHISEDIGMERVVTMTGPPHTVVVASNMICKKFTDDKKMLPHSTPNPTITLRFLVPTVDCKELLEGDRLKEIRDGTGVSIECSQEFEWSQDTSDRVITMTGSTNAILRGMHEVFRIDDKDPNAGTSAAGATAAYQAAMQAQKEQMSRATESLVASGMDPIQAAIFQHATGLMGGVMMPAAPPVSTYLQTGVPAVVAQPSQTTVYEGARSVTVAMAAPAGAAYPDPTQVYTAEQQQQYAAAGGVAPEGYDYSAVAGADAGGGYTASFADPTAYVATVANPSTIPAEGVSAATVLGATSDNAMAAKTEEGDGGGKASPSGAGDHAARFAPY